MTQSRGQSGPIGPGRPGPGRQARSHDRLILRYAAFSDGPGRRQPGRRGAGREPASATRTCSAIAAEVGYSETAFITEDRGDGEYRVRYFSPLAEVPFCGHATVATAVALGPGEHRFVTNAGEVPVTVDDGPAGPP